VSQQQLVGQECHHPMLCNESKILVKVEKEKREIKVNPPTGKTLQKSNKE